MIKPLPEQQLIMIAHALGAIDGITYTNSEAAFRQSIENGFQYLEADFALTSDQQIVLYHHHHPETDSEKSWRKQKAYQMSWAELSSNKYVDKHPVLELGKFLTIVNEFPSIRIILDIKTRNKKKVFIAKQADEINYLNAIALKHYKNRKKDKGPLANFLFNLFAWSDSSRVYPHQQIINELVKSCDNNLLDRLIPQVDICSTIVVDGLYSFPTKIWKPSEETIEQSFLLALKNRCKYISLHASSVSDVEVQLSKQHDVEILVFGTNDQSMIKALENKGVSGFYVDNLH